MTLSYSRGGNSDWATPGKSSLPAREADNGKMRWVAAWATAPQCYNEPIPLPTYPQPVPGSLLAQTMRQLVRPAVAGTQLRVRLSNIFGGSTVQVGAASVADSGGADAITPGTASILKFKGATAVCVPAGCEVWSDPLARNVIAGADLALSLYFPDVTPFGTVHRTPLRTGYLTHGNTVMAPALPDAMPVLLSKLVSGIDVMTGNPELRVLVAFGDSITDGFASTPDTLRRYPDQLAARLAADPLTAGTVSVLNAGISGNRLLSDKLGQRGLARFERDVLHQTGATHVLIQLGINDIGFGMFSGPPFGLIPASEVSSASRVIEGYKRMIDHARDRGLKVLLGTLLPFKGAPYYTSANDARRQAVNCWIRRHAPVHAVVDFDAVMANPADPLALNPPFDSGDHLHPSDAGYEAMAKAVPLAFLLD